MSSKDIRSEELVTRFPDGWEAQELDIDIGYDAVQIISGTQADTVVTKPVYKDMYSDNPPVGSDPYPKIFDRTKFALLVDKNLNPEVNKYITVGFRSIGYARLFFLNPVTFEVLNTSVFTCEYNDGIYEFVPSPKIGRVILPAQPSDIEPKDGKLSYVHTSSLSAVELESSVTFEHVVAGDILRIRYQTVDVSDTVPSGDITGVHNKHIILSIDGSADIKIILISTNANQSLTAKYIVDQINAAVGFTVFKVTSRIVLESDHAVTIRYEDSSVNDSLLNNPTLKMFNYMNGADLNNTADGVGEYLIREVAAHKLHLEPLTAKWVYQPGGQTKTFLFQHFSIIRRQHQRISSKEMQDNLDENGLYYFDVELVSKGIGDSYNLPAGISMKIDKYHTHGYLLSNKNPVLAFSEFEEPILSVPVFYFSSETTDSYSDATSMYETNIGVTYNTSNLVPSVQSSVESEEERNTCQNPIAKHLLPHFVRMDIEYTGGSKESIIEEDLKRLIEQDLYPEDYLCSSDIQSIIESRGASYVKNPIQMVAIVHNDDRSITAEISSDKLGNSRLSTFFIDHLGIRRV